MFGLDNNREKEEVNIVQYKCVLSRADLRQR